MVLKNWVILCSHYDPFSQLAKSLIAGKIEKALIDHTAQTKSQTQIRPETNSVP
jgi:hypothetical protein